MVMLGTSISDNDTEGFSTVRIVGSSVVDDDDDDTRCVRI